MIAAGGNFTLALQNQTVATGWGNNDSGSTTIPAGSYKALSGPGDGYAVGLTATGQVVTWGGNAYQPPTGLTHVKAIAGDFVAGLALLSNGTVVQWGEPSATQPPSGLAGVTVIAADDNSNRLALKSDGTVVGWGSGSGESDVPPGLSGVVAISAGFSHSLAL